MNIIDLRVATVDMTEKRSASPFDNVNVQGTHGAEAINGLGVVEVGAVPEVYVLDSSGKPAVSSQVVAKLEEEIERLTEYIEDTEANCIECGDSFMPKVESSATLYYCGGCREEAVE